MDRSDTETTSTEWSAHIDPHLDEETPWRSRDSSLFPEKPAGLDYGVLLQGDSKQSDGIRKCRDIIEISLDLKKSPSSIKAIFIPELPYGFPPEMRPTITYFGKEDRRKQFLKSFKGQGLVGLAMVGLGIYQPHMMMLAILGIVFFLFPVLNNLLAWILYPSNFSEEDVRRRGIDVTLFHKWLDTRKTGFRWIVAFVIALVIIFLIQMTQHRDVSSASLILSKVRDGEWWRLLTAGVLHGHELHIFFNCFALISIGKIMSAMTSVRVLAIVFLFSLIGGSLASYGLRGSDIPSVGASGGILGCLGYLAALTIRFRKSIPSEFTMMIIRNICLVGLIGIIGIRYIDNSAHAGGLLTGILCTFLIGPQHKDWWNFRTSFLLNGLAVASLLVLLATMSKAIWEMVT